MQSDNVKGIVPVAVVGTFKVKVYDIETTLFQVITKQAVKLAFGVLQND
jgi:hypothetical protein